MSHRLVDADSTTSSALGCFQLTLCETPSAPALLRALIAQPERVGGRVGELVGELVGHLLARALAFSPPNPTWTLAFHAKAEIL